jgi:hypothetical protein
MRSNHRDTARQSRREGLEKSVPYAEKGVTKLPD